MKHFFRTKKRKDKLHEILRSWEGTPYRHRTGVKGRGVDCIHFVACSMVEAQVITKFTVPDYPSDWHLHKGSEMLKKELNKYECTVEYDPRKKKPIDGDILLFKYGKTSAHATIYFKGYVWQAISKDEVRKNSLKSFRTEPTVGFRIIEV